MNTVIARLAVAFALAAVPVAAVAAEGAEFSFGLRAGFFHMDLDRAYEGMIPTHIAEMDGDISESSRPGWKTVPVLSQQVRPLKHLAFELTERWWQVAVKGLFPQSPRLNYRMSKTVIPVDLLVKGVLPLGRSERFMMSFGAGPGLYTVINDERGWFGSGHDVDPAVGLRMRGGFEFRVSPHVGLRLDAGGDIFDIPQKNIVMEDGGKGGGFTFTCGVEIILDPKYFTGAPDPGDRRIEE